MQETITRLAPAVLLVGLTILVHSDPTRAQSDGAQLFKANCTLCHGVDGSGNTPPGKAMKAKDLRSDEVQKQTDDQLTEVISKGKGKMPAFGSKFSADETKSLVAYIRQLAKK